MIKERMRSIPSRLGWQGVLGLVLIATTLLFNARLHAPLKERLEATEHSLASKTRLAAVQGQDGTLDFERFRAYFGTGHDITDWLAILHIVAEEKGIQLKSAEYRVHEEREIGLTGYRIDFPVTGKASAIQDFAQTSLQKIPVMSLDLIRLARKQVTDTHAEAELRVTFYIAAR